MTKLVRILVVLVFMLPNVEVATATSIGTVGPSEQVAQGDCINLPVEEFVRNRPKGKPCKSLRLGLYKRCILNGGKDEYTQNCAAHTFPDDHIGAPKIVLNSKIRKQLYRQCDPSGKNIACCDHITVKDQCEINTCGRRTGSMHCENVGVGTYSPPKQLKRKICYVSNGKRGKWSNC